MNGVIYARYSSSAQTEQSIEGQLRVCRDFAVRNGINIVHEYIDRALSGCNDHRPSFQNMLRDSRKKQFSFVVVYKLDRFSRNRYDSAIYKRELSKNNVRLMSATEEISERPEGIIMEAILEAYAEYYSKELSQKVQRGMRESALKGMSTGARPPFGYRIVDKKIIVDQKEADAVKYVFSQYADGMPLKHIVDQLNERGCTNSQGGKLKYKSFSAILKNPKYIGQGHYDNIPVPWPPIIDQEVFDRVQQRLELNRRTGRPASKNMYLLRGKVLCGYCSAPLNGESGRNRSNVLYQYYACSNRKRFRQCMKGYEVKSTLEDYVIDQTIKYILNPSVINRIADGIVSSYSKNPFAQQVEHNKKQIENIEAKLDRAVALMLQYDPESPTVGRIKGSINEMENERKLLTDEYAQLELRTDNQMSREEIVDRLKSYCSERFVNDDDRRAMIDIFISSVIVSDHKIAVFYNLWFDKRVEMADIKYTKKKVTDKLAGGSEIINFGEPEGPLTDLSEDLFLFDRHYIIRYSLIAANLENNPMYVDASLLHAVSNRTFQAYQYF